MYDNSDNCQIMHPFKQKMAHQQNQTRLVKKTLPKAQQTRELSAFEKVIPSTATVSL